MFHSCWRWWGWWAHAIVDFSSVYKVEEEIYILIKCGYLNPTNFYDFFDRIQKFEFEVYEKGNSHTELSPHRNIVEEEKLHCVIVKTKARKWESSACSYTFCECVWKIYRHLPSIFKTRRKFPNDFSLFQIFFSLNTFMWLKLNNTHT